MRVKTSVLLIPAVLSLSTASYALARPTAKLVKKPAAHETAPAAVVPANVVMGKKIWALLVGISQYQSSQIASLHYPADDVKSVAKALEDPTLGDVPEDHIKLLTNDQATKANIEGAVDSFFKPNVKPGDTVIVFLAGHGVAKGIGAAAKGYLLPYDVHGLTLQALDASAVNLHDLSNNLGQLPAAQFIAFVDACREDPTPGRGVRGNVMTDVVNDSMQITPDAPTSSQTHPNSVTFFACSVGQRAYEDPTKEHGVFTYYILNGIKNAAVPKKPNGAIDMAILASSVTTGVTDWAKEQSSSGDFEVDQTPQLVPAPTNTSPITLMDVSRPYPDQTIAPLTPTLTVSTYPAGADVTVDGKDVGAGTIEAALEQPGEHTVEAVAPGYAPFQKTFNALPGYPAVVSLTLPPAARGVTDTQGTPTVDIPDTYTRAQQAEKDQEYDIAEVGYQTTITAHPDFTPAYESLAALYRRQQHIGEYLGTLVDENGQTPPTAHTLSLLAQAYAQYCLQGPGQSTGDMGGTKGKDFGFPKSQKDAGDLAVKAANAAIAADSTSAEAQRSLGFALIAQDTKFKNEQAATKAFATAAFMDDKDASNHYGLGYCKRYYAQTIKDNDARNARLQEAVTELNKAIALRPAYYEAHRELAYCYQIMGDRPNAEKEYNIAQGYRGQATDGDEFAGTDCAMAALYNQDAAAQTDPQKKQEYQNASDGCIADAKEITPNLKKALMILRQAGLSTSIEDYLPDSVKNLIDWKSTLSDQINSHLGGFGGGFHF